MKNNTLFLILGSVLVLALVYYKNKEKFETVAETFQTEKKKQNPLYASSDKHSDTHVLHVSPPGDKDAMKKGNVGLGTSGGFLPLQGNGAQLFMANSGKGNKMFYTGKEGKVGGFPNYSTRNHDSTWVDGHQDFGHKKGKIYSSSHLINGANERVAAHGQTDSKLKCRNQFPFHKKNSNGVCTTGHEDITHPDFVKHKEQTRAQKVLDN